MKFSTVLFLVSGLMVTLVSCSDNSEMPSGNAYTLKPSKDYPDTFEFVAFITDETGSVLDEGKTKPGKTLTLYAPEDYTGQVDFHYATRSTLSSAFNFSIYTTPDVAPGWVSEPSVGKAVETPPYIHALEVFDIPDEYDVMRHAGPTVRPLTSFVSDIGLSQLFFSSYETGPVTYVLQTANSGSPRYLQITDPAPGENDQVEFSEFTAAEKTVFSVGTQSDRISASISALYPEGKTCNLGTSVVTDTDNIDLYYYPEDIFSAYVTYIESTIGGIKYGYRKYGNRVTDMHWIDAEISSLTVDGNTLTAVTTGTYGEFSVSGDNQWTIGDTYYSLSWRINMKEQPNQTVVLPDVIEMLEKYWEPDGATITLESGTLSSGTVENNVGEVLSASRAVD